VVSLDDRGIDPRNGMHTCVEKRIFTIVGVPKGVTPVE
jgi:hypothetical protein